MESKKPVDIQHPINIGMKDKDGMSEGFSFINEIASLAKFPSENPNPVMRLSFDGTVLYVNKAGEPFIRKWNISLGNKIPENVNQMISGIESGSHKDIEIECCSRIFSFTVVPISEEGYINLYGHDITQQKMAEEGLRFQANIIQNISDVIYATDLQLRITKWNSAAEKLYGWKEKEVMGKSVLEATRSKFDLNKRKELERILLEKGIVRTQIEHLTKSGSTIFLDSITMVHKNSEGQIIGYISTNRDITNKVLAEKALQESEEKYRTMIETAQEGIWIVDVQRSTKYVNARMAEMLGYEPAEMISKPWQYFIIEEEKFDLNSKNQNRKGKKLLRDSYEYTLKRKDGTSLWVIINSAPLIDHSGKFSGSLNMLTDISKRKKAEEDLAESELRYKELVSNAKSIILKMDTKGRFIFVNEFAQNFFGYKKEELIGKTAFETIVPKTDSTGRDMEKMIEDIYKDPDKFSVNINENKKKNSERVWIEWHNKALFDKDGKKMGHIAIGIDVTERKKSEDALQVARQKLNIALENAGIGLWEWDLQTGEIIWDERLEKMFGLNPGSFGRTFTDFENLVHEEDMPHIQKSVRRTLEKGIPLETIFRIKMESGNLKYISSKAFLNKNKAGKPIRLCGVSFDITGMREETENLILELNEELLRSNKELESFAYVASHDLQEPLRMVTSFTQMLEKHYKDKLDERGMEYIRFASDGAKRMYELLNGLLAYSRINKKGRMFYAVNMNLVVDTVLKNLSFKIAERKAIIKSRKLPRVLADESQMIQVLQNLISNSIRFSTATPRINISCRTEKDQYVFSVKDKGIGIESQYFDRIFLIFQRLHPKDQFEGTGIGLAICKRIIERHGGKIWVKSEPENGSTFYFSIPRNTSLEG